VNDVTRATVEEVVAKEAQSAPRLDVTLVIIASGGKPKVAMTEELIRNYEGALVDLGKSFEVILVDDGVGGEFLEYVSRLTRERPRVRGIRFRRAFGESVAIATAVSMATGRIIITSTWYQQVGVDAVRGALERLDAGDFDYVAVRRTRRVDSALARLQSWAFNAYTRFLTKADIRDLNCSFRAFRREVVAELSFHGDLFRFISILALQKGFRVTEIPVQHEREEGPSTFFNVGLVGRRLLDILSLFFLIKFTKKPLRFFGMVGLAFFVVGTAICGYMAYQKIFSADGRYSLADKPMLVLGVFLVVLGVIVGSIGLIGEIIIFLQGREFRDYHVDRVIVGGSERRAG
jgi:glycosyltransferase involved in cell wall biosynthesis